MAETYNKKIGRDTDWGGDKSTNYLPVAGNRVQEFIKEEIGTKIGAFYKPEGSNVVYCFANVDDKNTYLADQEHNEHLIIDRLVTESTYSVTLNRENLIRTKSVMKGTTGNRIHFEFKITDKFGGVADSKASIEYIFESGGNRKRYTTQIPMSSEDWTVVDSEIIDNYLALGENVITISIQGLYTKSSYQFIITYNVFDLDYKPYFAYNNAIEGNSLEIPYMVSCIEKPIYIEFYVDGQKDPSFGELMIDEFEKDAIYYIPASGFLPGKHTLQTRAYINSDESTKFYTNIHYYSFCIQGETDPVFLFETELDPEHQIVENNGNLVVKVNQFEEFSMNWSVFDRLDRRFTVYFKYDGEVILKPVFNNNGSISKFSFKPLTYGNGKELEIYAEDSAGNTLFDETIYFNVIESSIGVKETVDGLLMKMSAIGKRNSDSDYDTWEYVGTNGRVYSAEFNNFAWNEQQGWSEKDEALVISNGAFVEFNIKPMETDWASTEGLGGAVEIDIETFDIKNDDALICKCEELIDGNPTSYFKITATSAEFSTANGKKINTRYKDGERLKIAFIGNRAKRETESESDNEDSNLIYIMVNGVLERAIRFENGDRIFSNSKLKIGSEDGGCKIKLHSVRVYNRAIEVDEEFNNFVIDSPNSQEIFEKNDILENGSVSKVGFDKVANKLPVMIFTGNIKGVEKNTWSLFDVEYINRQEPERNFVAFNCEMKLQGTSSLGYPRKNYKLKTKNKIFSAQDTNFYRDLYRVDFENTTEGNRRLRLVGTTDESGLLDFGDLKTGCLMYDYQGNPLNKGKYRFRSNSHKATKWTLKADYMESSCSHNVGAARSWNDIFENTPFTPGSFAGYQDNTYQNSALVCKASAITYTVDDITYNIPRYTNEILAQKKYVCRTDAQKICEATGADDIRTAVDGFPMVCFYRTSHKSNDLVFMGQYNFINDKGSYEVFGFEDIEDPNDPTDKTMVYDASNVECWEGLKNTNPVSQFRTIDNWNDPNSGWQTTYESRYPDPEDTIIDSSALFELSKWVVSTKHDNETHYEDGDTITIDARFAKRINNYQYGYPDDSSSKESYFYLENNADIVTVPDTPENRQLKFKVEKWEHFDMWKVAGYYIYLMRYGAVDQFVKNTMLFTDGNGLYDERVDKKYRKWFFLNYDNDCLFGLRNNGELAFDWKLDRQTIDYGGSNAHVDIYDEYSEEGANTYAMMGHDSVLWNNLEADDEFMHMVRDLDNSMSSYKLNYDNMVTEFDTKQTEMWCERIYNANERYKYIHAAKAIGDMSGETPADVLWMLQGTRRSHRHWWIANHFNLLDAKWLSGNYRDTYVLFKINCNSGETISAVAGTDFYFAWGQQKSLYESNIVKKEGDAIDFTFSTKQGQGDPVVIYAFNKMSEMDFSSVAKFLDSGSLQFNPGKDDVANLLKKLVVGNPEPTSGNTNATLVTSSWNCLTNLEYLDIENMKSVSEVPFESFKNLKVLKGLGSGISKFAPPQGCVFDLIQLPDTVQILILDNILFSEGHSLSDSFEFNCKRDKLRTVEIYKTKNNGGVTNIYFTKIIKPWLRLLNGSDSISDIYSRAILRVDEVRWVFTEFSDIELFENISKYSKDFNMRGVIELNCNYVSMENIQKIKHIFGENCFSEEDASLYIKTPESVFIHTDKTEMVAGQTHVFTREIYPDETALIGKDPEIGYRLVKEVDSTVATPYIDYANNNRRYVELTQEEIFNLRNKNGVGSIEISSIKVDGKEAFEIKTKEFITRSDTQLKVMVYLKIGDSYRISVCDFTIKDPTYAAYGYIVGDKSLHKKNQYVFTADLYTLSNEKPIGTETVQWYITGDNVEMYVENSYDENNTLDFRVITSNNEPLISERLTINAIVTNGTGGTLNMQYNVLVLNDNVILTSETNPVIMSICHNKGWTESSEAMLKEEAENVESIGFATGFSNLTTSNFSFNEFQYFTNVTEIPENAFKNSYLTEITLPPSIHSVGNGAFELCTRLIKINSKDNNGVIKENFFGNDYIDVVNEKTFLRCSLLGKLILSNNITTIKNNSFGGTKFTKALLGEEKLDNDVLILPRYITTIERYTFETSIWDIGVTDNKLEEIEIPLTLSLSQNSIEILYGKNYKNFITENDLDGGNQKYKAVDGILYNGSLTELIKYPPKKPKTGVYEILSLESIPVQILRGYSFLFVKTLDEIITTKSLNSIGDYCFETCDIKNINLNDSDNVTYIPTHAFSNCNLLTEILLPPGITKIGTYAFVNCPRLGNINFPDTITSLGWTNVQVGTRVEKHGYNFVNCGFSELVLPDSIEECGHIIISDCSNLRLIKLPGKLELYAQNQDANFYIINCQSLEKIVLPVSSYDNEGTSVIVNQTYPELVLGAPSLKEYEINSDDNGENSYIYDDCIYSKANNLLKVPFGKTGITINENCVGISDRALLNCHAISYIDVPDSVTSLGNRCFEAMTGLLTVKLSKNVTSLPYGTFYNCVNLDTLYLNGNIISIGTLALCQCYNLKTIYIFADKAPTLVTTNQTAPHPFGGNWYGYAGISSKIYGENKIFVIKGATGYDSNVWLHPVTDEEYCDYDFDYIYINGNIELTIYKNGELFDNGSLNYVYASSEYGEIGTSSAIKVGEGKFELPVNKLYHGETLYVYSDPEMTEESLLGSIVAEYGKYEYQIGEPTRNLSMGKGITLKSGVFSAGNIDEEQDNEIVAITKNEYISIKSNLDYLNGIIRNLKK